MRVLVVDDSGFSRSVIANLFSQVRARCVVEEASSGEAALRRTHVAAVPFDLITVDIHMPGMDGLQLVQELQNRGVPSKISLVTANVQEAAKNRARALGVAFIPKPLNQSKLNGLLKELNL